jgi:hypothetical protein
MFKRPLVWCLGVLLVWSAGTAWAQELYSDRTVYEKLMAQINSSTWLPETFKVSADNKRIAYIVQVGNEQLVVVDGIEGRLYDSIVKGSLVFSSDSKRFAYVAQEGNKQIVVVDGAEEKPYDGMKTNPIFSSDSKNVVYIALVDDKVCVVVNGKEGKLYDEILNTGWGKIVFDSSDSLYYFARKGSTIYLVKEWIK